MKTLITYLIILSHLTFISASAYSSNEPKNTSLGKNAKECETLAEQNKSYLYHSYNFLAKVGTSIYEAGETRLDGGSFGPVMPGPIGFIVAFIKSMVCAVVSLVPFGLAFGLKGVEKLVSKVSSLSRKPSRDSDHALEKEFGAKWVGVRSQFSEDAETLRGWLYTYENLKTALVIPYPTTELPTKVESLANELRVATEGFSSFVEVLKKRYAHELGSHSFFQEDSALSIMAVHKLFLFCKEKLELLRSQSLITLKALPKNVVIPPIEKRDFQSFVLGFDASEAAVTKKGRLIGKGGAGHVLEARQNGKPVAVKVITNLELRDATEQGLQISLAVEAFVRANQIEPSPVPQFYYYDPKNDPPEVVMELIDGESLASLIQRSRGLSPNIVGTIFQKILRALVIVHHIATHADLKPENILLDRKGNVKLVDFGGGKLADPDFVSRLARSLPSVTEADHVAQSLIYQPKEPWDKNDRTRDFYALGVILFELVTGEKPVGRESISEVLHRRASTNEEAKEKLNVWPHDLLKKVDELYDSLFASKMKRERKFPNAEKLFQEVEFLFSEVKSQLNWAEVVLSTQSEQSSSVAEEAKEKASVEPAPPKPIEVAIIEFDEIASEKAPMASNAKPPAPDSHFIVNERKELRE